MKKLVFRKNLMTEEDMTTHEELKRQIVELGIIDEVRDYLDDIEGEEMRLVETGNPELCIPINPNIPDYRIPRRWCEEVDIDD